MSEAEAAPRPAHTSATGMKRTLIDAPTFRTIVTAADAVPVTPTSLFVPNAVAGARTNWSAASMSEAEAAPRPAHTSATGMKRTLIDAPTFRTIVTAADAVPVTPTSLFVPNAVAGARTNWSAASMSEAEAAPRPAHTSATGMKRTLIDAPTFRTIVTAADAVPVTPTSLFVPNAVAGHEQTGRRRR